MHVRKICACILYFLAKIMFFNFRCLLYFAINIISMSLKVNMCVAYAFRELKFCIKKKFSVKTSV